MAVNGQEVTGMLVPPQSQLEINIDSVFAQLGRLIVENQVLTAELNRLRTELIARDSSSG